MAEAGARAHHFISQCYLKGFTHNGSKKSKLFVIGLEQLKTFETRPENVAHRRDFNRIEGLPPGELDQRLGQFEGQADKALQKIAADRSLDDSEAWIHVLNLAALFAVRHPRQRENVRQFMERTAKLVAEMTVANRQRYESQIRQAQAACFVDPDSAVTYEQVRDFVKRGDYTISVPTARHIALEFHVFETVLQTLIDRRWMLCVAGGGAGHFVTSDHPVILVNTDGTPPSLMKPIGHGLTGTSLFFPVSRELFAVGTFEGPAGVRHVDSRSIANLNGIVLAHADREVYAPSGRVPIEIDGEVVMAAGIVGVLQRLKQAHEAKTHR